MYEKADEGMVKRDVCRKHNDPEQPRSRWKKTYGGMGTSEQTWLKEVERENVELKVSGSEQALDIQMLKGFNRKKW